MQQQQLLPFVPDSVPGARTIPVDLIPQDGKDPFGGYRQYAEHLVVPESKGNNSIKALASGTLFDDSKKTYMMPIERPKFLSELDDSAAKYEGVFEHGDLGSYLDTGRKLHSFAAVFAAPK